MSNILKIIEALFRENNILYISAPITSGKRFLDRYTADGKCLATSKDFNAQEFIEVKTKNIELARAEIEKIKKKMTYRTVIAPTTLEDIELNWTQEKFYEFWSDIISKLVQEVIFLDDWEYSIGCCHEYLAAIKKRCRIYSKDLQPINFKEAIEKIEKAKKISEGYSISVTDKFIDILGELRKNLSEKQDYCPCSLPKEIRLKDEKLDYLSSTANANIARFFSISPDNRVRFCHINQHCGAGKKTVRLLLEDLFSTVESVNVRSFSPTVLKGNKFDYGLTKNEINLILEIIEKNQASGKYSIINETINVDDGGVSGVMLDGMIEFAPNDTPKCVDKPDVCLLPKDIGLQILTTVYGFMPSLDYDADYRVEFSIHPERQGLRREHTVIWEYEYCAVKKNNKKITWPNRFSRFIGDKTFGLLLADALGILVPQTTVISRHIAPFTFGKPTNLSEKWIRTSPFEKIPGQYYSGKSWRDPFVLMNEEEQNFSNLSSGVFHLASILSQNAIEPIYSGGAYIKKGKCVEIDGTSGPGDLFMLGKQQAENLPTNVVNSVNNLCSAIGKFENLLGNVKIEWVFDGYDTWLVQINQVKTINAVEGFFVDGQPTHFIEVNVEDGLDALRAVVEKYKGTGKGIKLVGNVGFTSHFGDILRDANIPSYLVHK